MPEEITTPQALIPNMEKHPSIYSLSQSKVFLGMLAKQNVRISNLFSYVPTI
jgi:hypothetical protein